MQKVFIFFINVKPQGTKKSTVLMNHVSRGKMLCNQFYACHCQEHILICQIFCSISPFFFPTLSLSCSFQFLFHHAIFLFFHSFFCPLLFYFILFSLVYLYPSQCELCSMIDMNGCFWASWVTGN